MTTPLRVARGGALFDAWEADTLERLPEHEGIPDLAVRDAVISGAAKVCVVTVREITGRSRYHHICNARHLTWRLLREGFGWPAQKIGRAFSVDHTSVLHGCKAIAEDTRLEPIAAAAFDDLAAQFGVDALRLTVKGDVA